MTTPAIPSPSDPQLDTLTRLLGVGAYEIGGGSENYGQNIDSNFVYSLIKGPSADFMGGVAGVVDSLVEIGTWLLTLPLEILQLFIGHIPNTDESDFADVPTAVNTIISLLSQGPEILLETLLTFPLDVLQVFMGFIPGITHLFQSVASAAETIVNLLVQGPGAIISLIMGALGANLGALPLEALQIFDGIIPGKTSEDFQDVPTAVATILDQFGFGLFGAFQGFFGVIMQVLQAIFGIFTGDLSGVEEILNSIPIVGPVLSLLLGAFTDLLSLLGNPLGLGTGEFTLPESVTDIPIIGPLLQMFMSFVEGIMEAFEGNPIEGFFNILTDVFGLFGAVTGLGSGTPGLPDLEDIPILGPILGVFEDLIDQMLTNLGLTPLGTILDKLFDLDDAFFDLVSNADGAAAGLDDLLSDLLNTPSTVIGTLASTNIPTLAQSKITNLTTDLAAKLTSASNLDAGNLINMSTIPMVPSTRVTGVNGHTVSTNLGNITSPYNSMIAAAADTLRTWVIGGGYVADAMEDYLMTNI